MKDGLIDTHLFIEVILSEGANELYNNDKHGIKNKYFSGRNNIGRVLICVEDEHIPYSTARGILEQLGFNDIIDSLLT